MFLLEKFFGGCASLAATLSLLCVCCVCALCSLSCLGFRPQTTAGYAEEHAYLWSSSAGRAEEGCFAVLFSEELSRPSSPQRVVAELIGLLTISVV